MKNLLLRFFLVTASAGLASPAALALSTDRDQPAQIVADEIEFDFNTGVRTYTGNVSIVQGTLRITADKLVANYDKEGVLLNATAWGNLASFQQRPDDKDSDTIGKGREIIVDEVANTLTLITTASLTQGQNTATGARIIYDMATDKLKIQGGGGAARINTVGKDGSTLPPGAATPPAPAVPAAPAVPSSPVSPSAQGAASADPGEGPAATAEDCKGKDCAKPIVNASIPRVDLSVSPTGRSRVIIHPSSDPAPATSASAREAADKAKEKLAEAIESDPEAVDEAKEKIMDAIDAAGTSEAPDE